VRQIFVSGLALGPKAHAAMELQNNFMLHIAITYFLEMSQTEGALFHLSEADLYK
jgi:hypothetical protein